MQELSKSTESFQNSSILLAWPRQTSAATRDALQESMKNSPKKKNLALPEPLSEALDAVAKRLFNEKAHSRVVAAALMMLLAEGDDDIQRRVGDVYGVSGNDSALRRMMQSNGAARFLSVPLSTSPRSDADTGGGGDGEDDATGSLAKIGPGQGPKPQPTWPGARKAKDAAARKPKDSGGEKKK